jgi:hypothetical protein
MLLHLLAPLLAFSPSLSFLPADYLTAGQVALVTEVTHDLRLSLLFTPAYSRHGGGHRAADRPMGGVLVRPPEERRVSVQEGFRRHLDAAACLTFPMDSRLRASSLPPDIQAAIFHAVRSDDLPALRASAIATIVTAAERLRPVSERINLLMPATVAKIAAKVNTAFMAALVDALGWLDVSLVRRFVLVIAAVARNSAASGSTYGSCGNSCSSASRSTGLRWNGFGIAKLPSCCGRGKRRAIAVQSGLPSRSRSSS